MQFKDALISIKASLEAGYSMENAVLAAGEDLACIYPKNSCPPEESYRISRYPGENSRKYKSIPGGNL